MFCPCHDSQVIVDEWKLEATLTLRVEVLVKMLETLMPLVLTLIHGVRPAHRSARGELEQAGVKALGTIASTFFVTHEHRQGGLYGWGWGWG
jgi:hypothetical protein